MRQQQQPPVVVKGHISGEPWQYRNGSTTRKNIAAYIMYSRGQDHGKEIAIFIISSLKVDTAVRPRGD